MIDELGGLARRVILVPFDSKAHPRHWKDEWTMQMESLSAAVSGVNLKSKGKRCPFIKYGGLII